MNEPVDLFGRTEAEVVAAIARAKLRLSIAEGYRGNESIALKQETMRSNIRVDERCLARLQGKPVRYGADDPPPPNLTGTAVDRWRAMWRRRR